MTRTILMAAIVVLAAAASALAADDALLKPGTPAPDFTLPGSDGKTYSLKDFAGKKMVVLAWFPKAFTTGCTAECKSMRDSGEAIGKFDVAYFAVSTDTPETNRKFARELGLHYPILSDPEKHVAQAYGVVHPGRLWAERWTFYIGRDGTIQRIDRQINTSRAGQDIAATLAELKAPQK